MDREGTGRTGLHLSLGLRASQWVIRRMGASLFSECVRCFGLNMIPNSMIIDRDPTSSCRFRD